MMLSQPNTIWERESLMFTRLTAPRATPNTEYFKYTNNLGYLGKNQQGSRRKWSRHCQIPKQLTTKSHQLNP